ncbi:MAG: DUF4131 domain-containing protein, partial [Chthoniobacterales bacterium]|nr:DUF4131 domain-containing protein [Chthoniobacterales bacterium]
MKPAVPRRLPLLGVALSAVPGLLLAEILALPLALLGPAIVLGTILNLLRPRWWLTHLLVAAFYFALHQTRLHDTRGRELKARLGDRPRTVAVSGTVASEPRLSPNDYTTFL